MKRFLLLWLSTVALTLPLRGQGFMNLDFESAQVIISTNDGNNNSFIASINALPGWSTFEGTNQLSLVQYDYDFNGHYPLPPIGLFGSSPYAFFVIGGNFSVFISGNGSISQSGLVPDGSESLLFDAASSSLLVSLNGQNLPFTAISSALNPYGLSYNLYAADVSAFAGQIATLTFSQSFGTDGFLDNIQFSPEAVPEPTSAAVLLLGGGVLFYARRKYRR